MLFLNHRSSFRVFSIVSNIFCQVILSVDAAIVFLSRQPVGDFVPRLVALFFLGERSDFSILQTGRPSLGVCERERECGGHKTQRRRRSDPPRVPSLWSQKIPQFEPRLEREKKCAGSDAKEDINQIISPTLRSRYHSCQPLITCLCKNSNLPPHQNQVLV